MPLYTKQQTVGNSVVSRGKFVLLIVVLAEDETLHHVLEEMKHSYSADAFKKVVLLLLDEEKNVLSLQRIFHKFCEYDDVRFRTFHILRKSLQDHQKPGETYLVNAFGLLQGLRLVHCEEEELGNFYFDDCADRPVKMSSLKEHKRLFRDAWLAFLRNELSPRLYKKVLPMLADRVMPCMPNPLPLSDFLITACDQGGVVAILALHGLFVLVNQYNLQYPDLYSKLYSLFQPVILEEKFKEDFMSLADIFLSSTHISATLVASFIKRLARLCLRTSPAGILLGLPFIRNLMIRHPTCTRLIHRPDRPKAVEEDPFNETEPDPEKTNALASSLWEIKELQSHAHPDVALEAMKISKAPGNMESELAPKLELTMDMLVTRGSGTKRKRKKGEEEDKAEEKVATEAVLSHKRKLETYVGLL